MLALCPLPSTGVFQYQADNTFVNLEYRFGDLEE